MLSKSVDKEDTSQNVTTTILDLSSYSDPLTLKYD